MLARVVFPPDRTRRGLSSAIIALALVTTTQVDVSAQAYTPVAITLEGPNPILVKVAAGVFQPCDSSSNSPLLLTKMSPGQTIVLQSPSNCICWQQTFDNFPDANWSGAQIACKSAMICRGRRCTLDRDPFLRLSLRSTESGR